MTLSIDSRSRVILLALMQATTPTWTAELAARLDLQPRMVPYRLPHVSTYLEQQGGVLHRQPEQGLRIEASPQVRDRILADLQELSGYDIVLSPVERQQVLTFTLLLEHQPTVTKQLQRRLGVSRSTLLKDLDRADDWFATRHLNLIRRPGFGIAVQGEERDRREAVVDLLLTNIEQQHLPLIYSGGNLTEALHSPSPSSTALACLRSLQIAHARRAAARAEASLGVQFADITYTALILYVAVLITRVAQGETVQVTSEIEHYLHFIKEQPCFLAAVEALEEIGRELRLPIPEDETIYLATTLVGAQVAHKFPGTAQGDGPDQVDVTALVKQLMCDAGELLDARLAEDEQLAQELTAHLEPFLRRLQFGVGVHNPLLEDLFGLLGS